MTRRSTPPDKSVGGGSKQDTYRRLCSVAGVPSIVRELLTVLLTVVGVFALLGGVWVGSFSTLVLLPDPVQATVCRGLFFCWPGLLLFLVVAIAVTIGLLSALVERGYLDLPDAW
jgi:hypothetical protein